MDIRISGHQVETGAAFGEHVRERLDAMITKIIWTALKKNYL